jgi:pimeloyl-ACP methyl ester carboxylesterase
MLSGLLSKTSGLTVPSPDINHSPSTKPSFFFEQKNGLLLAVDEYGQREGFPLFFFHDRGSSRLEASFFHRSSLKFGYRLIAIDRPGIGQSEFYDYKSADEFCENLLLLADELGIRQFGLMSMAAGGVFALRLAHMAQTRTMLHINIAGVPGNVFKEASKDSYAANCFRGLTPSVIKMLVGIKHRFFADSPASHVEKLKDLLSYTDKRLLTNPQFVNTLTADHREAVCHGYQGLAQDMTTCFKKLPFKLSELKTRTFIWQGSADQLSMRSDCEYLSSRLPNANYYRVPNGGHFFFVHGIDDVFNRLKEPAFCWSGKIAA